MKGVFGGNKVSNHVLNGLGRHVFAEGEYHFAIHTAAAGEHLDFGELRSCTLYLLNKAPSATVLDGEGREMAIGSVLQGENASLQLSIEGGDGVAACLLIAGTTTSKNAGISRTRVGGSEIKKVAKPWGHELWISGEHPGYCFKQIAIREGTRTSLQFHRFKRETNVLFSGEMRLHYKSNPNINNEEVSAADVATVLLRPGSAVDVRPGTLHRIEAVSDLVLFEVSTPQVADVVRVSDDTNRASGRIASEHGE